MKRCVLYAIFVMVLAFGAARPAYAATRYLGSMFSSVKTTTKVSYKQGLLLDIYEPEGDTETKFYCGMSTKDVGWQGLSHRLHHLHEQLARVSYGEVV